MDILKTNTPQITPNRRLIHSRNVTLLVTAIPALCTGIVVYCLLLSAGTDMNLPLAYHGDTLFAMAGFKSIAEGNFPPQNRRLAAPFERADWSEFPSYQWIDFTAFRILSLFTKNSITLLNWYWVLTIVAMAATGSYCLLRLGATPVLACCLGFLYAMQPFPFVRNLGHLNLVAYLVPLLATMCLEVALGRWETGKSRGFRDIPKFGWAAVLLQGISFFYFSFFGGLLLAAAAFFGACARRTFRPLVYTAWLLLALVGATVLGVSPTLVGWMKHGYNHEAVERHSAEAEVHGLKIRHMLTPVPFHPITFMRNVSELMTAEHPENTEATTTRLGLLAGVGFVGLMAYIVAALSGWKSGLDDETLAACAALLFTAFIWCTVGGFGSIFNTLVSPAIRGYDRIIVFVVFFILAAYATLATAWLDRNGWLKVYPLPTTLALVVLTGVSYADVHWILVQTPDERRQAISDREFVTSVERSLGGTGMVFQIPVTEFPNDGPGPGKMDSVDPIRAYVNSTSLRWSWGAVMGTEEAHWMRRTAELAPEKLVRELLSKGFRGLWIDTYGYTDDPSTMPADKIATLLGRRPMVSADGRYLFFELDPHQPLQTLPVVREFSASKPAGLAAATLSVTKSDCSIDLINGAPITSGSTIDHQSSLDLVGWSAVAKDGIAPDEVYINIYSAKTSLFARAQTLMNRADVAQALRKPSLLRSGFQLLGGPVPPDTYSLDILQVTHKQIWRCGAVWQVVVH